MKHFALTVSLLAPALLASGCGESPAHGSAAHADHANHAAHADHPPVAPMQAEEKQKLPPFIALGKEPKTVEILLVAAYDDSNGGMNFNGKTRGGATYTIPVGWKVNATFRNRSAVPHSAVVVETDRTKEFRPGAPFFPGAGTPDPEKGTTNHETVRFSFTPDEKGKFAIACAFPTHALAGHWIYLVVADANAKPTYQTGEETIEAK